MSYSEQAIVDLYEGLEEVRASYGKLFVQYVHREYKSHRAEEFAREGFSRRLMTMLRCVERIFELLPPEETEPPEDDVRSDATINLQAFVFNVFGCADNLAWVWAFEKGRKHADGSEIPDRHIGLRKVNKSVRESFSSEFQIYLASRDDWFGYQENFRHALAHRIPLYIPPYIVTPENEGFYRKLGDQMNEAMRRKDHERWNQLSDEQDALGKFVPWMTHSFKEEAKLVPFHNQILNDYKTIDEIGWKMLEELDRE
ncbi:MAG: hypothetical protein HZA67_02780 [Rhodospirillales bacterium]|nr:hypothetical protein [Rhodospirillales bacterium]